MNALQYDFKLDVAADWQKVIRLRDSSTGTLVGLSGAVMEIRNQNYVLALRLDHNSGRCVILGDGASIQLHISPEDSYYYLREANYPGAVQAVGIWGIGRAYVYDLFVLYDSGVQDRIMRGFFYVDPNISQPLDPSTNYALTVGQRGSYAR
jgi:hypothetical protein